MKTRVINLKELVRPSSTEYFADGVRISKSEYLFQISSAYQLVNSEVSSSEAGTVYTCQALFDR